MPQIAPIAQATFEDDTFNLNIAGGTAAPLAVPPKLSIVNSPVGDYSTKAVAQSADEDSVTDNVTLKYKMDDGNFPAGELFANDFTMFMKHSETFNPEDLFNTEFVTDGGIVYRPLVFGPTGGDQIQSFESNPVSIGTWSPGGFPAVSTAGIGQQGATSCITFDASTNTLEWTFVGPSGTATITSVLSGRISRILEEIRFWPWGNQDQIGVALFEDFRIYDYKVDNPDFQPASVTDWHTGPTPPQLRKEKSNTVPGGGRGSDKARLPYDQTNFIFEPGITGTDIFNITGFRNMGLSIPAMATATELQVLVAAAEDGTFLPIRTITPLTSEQAVNISEIEPWNFAQIIINDAEAAEKTIEMSLA